MLLILLSAILALSLSNCNAACTLSERGRSISNMRIKRTNPGMYYAVDRVRRPYDKDGCPSDTSLAFIKTEEEYDDWKNIGTGQNLVFLDRV